MKYLLLLACLILCSCLPQEEAEVENDSQSLPPGHPCSWDEQDRIDPIWIKHCNSSPCSQNKIDPAWIEYCSTTFLSPCTMPSEEQYEPDPSILDYCPAEDVAEYPIQYKFPENWCHIAPIGGCVQNHRLSKEELLFNAQGGVRCATVDSYFGLFGARDSGGYYMEKCVYEEIDENLPSMSDPRSHYAKKLKCPEKDSWITATRVDTRVLQISVNQNKTKAERKMYIELHCGSILITQSAE
jgi:hypothetical protein